MANELTTEDFKAIGEWLSSVVSQYNYQVAPAATAGKPGKVERTAREYRLQLVNKNSDTSEQLERMLPGLIKAKAEVTDIRFNSISPNSSKFASVSFYYGGKKFDVVIARGANRGENFETQMVGNLAAAFKTNKRDAAYQRLIDQLNDANKEFASVEVVKVQQRSGSTKKEGVPIEQLGAVIGDIVLTDSSGKQWFVSLKDTNGNTFSSYSGAASLFNTTGDLQPNSAGAKFLEAFGVDLNQVQQGFDQRNKKQVLRKKIPTVRPDTTKLKAIFERAWGMNYFYVRRLSSGWKVFWMDRTKLNKLASNIKIEEIRYPSAKSKQITIICSSPEQKYLIELRNSKAGEYPNDIKFKVV